MSAGLTAVIVCGSRSWTDTFLIEAKLYELERTIPGLLIIEGANPRGADRIAGVWAKSASNRGVGWVSMPARWTEHAEGWCSGPWCAARDYCLAAGARRNQAMLDRALQEDHQFVVAFKDDYVKHKRSGGTEDMCARAEAAGVHGVVIHHPR